MDYVLMSRDMDELVYQTLKHDTGRGRIEWFFKILKSCPGLEAFFRHDPDTALIPNFNLRVQRLFWFRILPKTWI